MQIIPIRYKNGFHFWDELRKWEYWCGGIKPGFFIALNISYKRSRVFDATPFYRRLLSTFYKGFFYTRQSFINASLFTWWVLSNHDINFDKRTTEYNLIFLPIVLLLLWKLLCLFIASTLAMALFVYCYMVDR